MAEKLGEGRRTSDMRNSGRSSRVRHTVPKEENDQRGDLRKLPRTPGVEPPGGAGGRVVPIAAVAGGGEPLERRENGGGRRAIPKALKGGEAR